MVAEDGKSAMVWPEDVPAEVARAAEAEARKLGLIKPEEGGAQKAPASVPRLETGPSAKRVRDESSSKAPPADGKPRAAKPRAATPAPKAKAAKRPERPKRELPPYLRVIK